MKEIVKINLDNEMDLILAHKRTMKLAELCGLTLSAQTTFATAVSEIARCAISYGESSHLVLNINTVRVNTKEIVAILYDHVDLSETKSDAIAYAKKLMGDVHAVKGTSFFEITLRHVINFGGTVSPAKIESFKEYFRSEPPISPYDEIRKKNIQLIDLANKLKESEREYKLLTDTLPIMMFALNKNGEVNYSNKWLRDFFGISQQGNSFLWHSPIHKEDLAKITKDWESCQSSGTILRAEGRMLGKDGKYLWHLINISPIKDEQENINKWIGFFVDINSQKLIEATLSDNKELKEAQLESKQYQVQLERKIKELHISNKSLEEFAFVSSHDLQEPLRKIRTFSNLLENELSLNEKQSSYFDKIKSSSQRMSGLITDVLNYSQLAGQNQQPTETDLNRVLKNVLIDIDLLVQETGTEVKASLLPVLQVKPLQITQLFTNLIQNSIKFSKGNPKISISSKFLSEEEIREIPELNSALTYHRISFEDNGVGFDEQYAEKIFIIFQRLNSERSGTGIGLALCKKIVENHNGHINASGKNGKGAIFNVFLPVTSVAS